MIIECIIKIKTAVYYIYNDGQIFIFCISFIKYKWTKNQNFSWIAGIKNVIKTILKKD